MSQRTFLTTEAKVAIIREHLVDDIPVSDLCDQHAISPVLYYHWQRQLFESDVSLFERKTNSANAAPQTDAQQRQIEELQNQPQQKNELVDYVWKWHEKTEIAQGQILRWMEVWSGTFCDWCRNYGKAFKHNG